MSAAEKQRRRERRHARRRARVEARSPEEQARRDARHIARVVFGQQQLRRLIAPETREVEKRFKKRCKAKEKRLGRKVRVA